MDAEEIQKKLTQLGQGDFRRTISLVLNKILNFNSVNVDGKGDGGSDWWTIADNGITLRIGIQDTVQNQDWQKKAINDAKKTKKKLNVNRYLFFTNRHHEQVTVTKLENEITKQTGLACTVYEGRRISELIHSSDLGMDFLEAVGEKVTQRPAGMPEICLCSYANLSADRKDHRDEIYRDALLIACHESSRPLSAADLVVSAAHTLGISPEHIPLLNKQLDHLKTKGRIKVSVADNNLELSATESSRLKETERLYLSDWAKLESAQAQTLKSFGSKIAWSEESSQQASVLIARMFLKQQLELLSQARIDKIVPNWISRIGNPEQQLRDLIQKHGITTGKITTVINQLVDLANGTDVITKLTRTITFVALEGKDPMLSAAALGHRSWDDVNALIDSSVAIPFICEQLHGTADTYIYQLSGNSVRLMQTLKSACKMISGHIEECAAHLIQAFRYDFIEEAPDFLSAIRASENAFIAYYGALRAEGRLQNESLTKFLCSFSSKSFKASTQFQDLREASRSIMPDIQKLLNDYGIAYTKERRVSVSRYGSLQKAFDEACIKSKRDRHPILREHDVYALQHLAGSTEQENESWIMLTWDKTFIEVAHDNLPGAFVISPEGAIDFAQPCRKLSDTQWCSLAHKLARVTSPADDLTARIIDKVTKLVPGKLRDADFRRNIMQFREEALNSLPSENHTEFHGWIEGKAAAFIHELKLSDPVKPLSSKREESP